MLSLAALIAATATAVVAASVETAAPISQRVASLLAQMSLEEKIAQLYIVHVGNESYVWNNQSLIDTGIGAQKLSLFGSANSAIELINLRNAYQSRFMNSSRLHIPVSFHTESLEGAGPGSTRLPMANCIGASWDPSIARRVGGVLGSELRALGTDVGYYVVQPVTRATFGRIEETSSEDARLAGDMGVAFSAGMQQPGTPGLTAGDAAESTLTYMPDDGAVFVAKHFAGYGAEAWNSQPVRVTPYYLRDRYVSVWRSVFWQGNARALMFMHASWNGLYAHASAELGQMMLRSELNSTALAVTDCACARNAFRLGMVTDLTSSAILSVRDATIDQELQCGGPEDWVYPFLPAAVQQGKLDLSVIDAAVSRVLTAKFAAGLFEQPFVDPEAAAAKLRTPEALQVALDAPAASVVLAKNTNAPLPWDPATVGRVAVIGPLGGCETSGHCPRMGLSKETMAVLGRTYNQIGENFTMPLFWELLLAQGVNATFSRGADIDSLVLNSTMLHEAVAAATAADAVLLVIGDSLTSCMEGQDRNILDPDGTQMQLIQAITSVTQTRGIPLVTVMVNGRPMTLGQDTDNSFLDAVDALLIAGRPGERGPEAILDIVFGRTEPSGRLAQAWPRKPADMFGLNSGPWYSPRIAAMGNSSTSRWEHPLWHDDAAATTPLFPFGFGLSYSTTTVSEPVPTAVAPVPAGPTTELQQSVTIPVGSTGVEVFPSTTVATVNVTVQNTGTRRAAAVVQLYCRDPDGLLVVRFYERLIGYSKVWVDPQQSVEVSIPISADALAIVSSPLSGYKVTVPPGTYGIWAAQSSDPRGWSPSGDVIGGVPLVIA
jgi:beta-glucosidase